MRFLLKHLVATGVIVLGAVALTVAGYFALLVWAILTNGGLGGPLALPGMVVIAFLASAAAVALVLLPVTAVTEALCLRVRRHRWIVEMIVATILLLAWLAAATAAFVKWRGADLNIALQLAAGGAAVFLILLGVYWWSTRATDLLLRNAGRLWRLATGK